MLHVGLRVVGGRYLLYLAFQMIRHANTPLELSDSTGEVPPSLLSAFTLGTITQICNPKTALVYGSIFAALIAVDTPTIAYVVLPPSVFVLEASWYAIVALALSAETPRAAYLRHKKWLDRAAGAVMGALGAKLVASASAEV